METPTKVIPLEEWFARITALHGDSFLLLKVTEGKISLLAVGNSLDTLDFVYSHSKADYVG